MSEIDDLKAMLRSALNRIEELEDWKSWHQGLDYGQGGAIGAPHPNTSVDTVEFGGSGQSQMRLSPHGIELKGTDGGDGQPALWYVFPFLTDATLSIESVESDVAWYSVLRGNADNTDNWMQLRSVDNNGAFTTVGERFADITVYTDATRANCFARLRSQDSAGNTAEIYAQGYGRYNTVTGQFQLWVLGADPSETLLDGALWYRSDTDKFRARANGATESLATESWVTNAGGGFADHLMLMGGG